MHYHSDNYINRSFRLRLVSAYDELVATHINQGWDAYFLNFMFNQISASVSRRMDVMEYEVGRVHDILTRHVLRWPDRDIWQDLRPKFIGSPDLPVYKHEKELVRNLVVNNGLHYNVLAIVPPTKRKLESRIMERAVFGRQSRLLVSIDKHLRIKQRLYLNDVLSRIHATPITRGTMADYTLKAFKNGRIEYDALQIWK